MIKTQTLLCEVKRTRKSPKDLEALPKSFIKGTSRVSGGDNHKDRGRLYCCLQHCTGTYDVFREPCFISYDVPLGQGLYVCASVLLTSNNVTCIGSPHEPSSCELSKMRMYIRMSDHIT